MQPWQKVSLVPEVHLSFARKHDPQDFDTLATVERKNSLSYWILSKMSQLQVATQPRAWLPQLTNTVPSEEILADVSTALCTISTTVWLKLINSYMLLLEHSNRHTPCEYKMLKGLHNHFWDIIRYMLNEVKKERLCWLLQKVITQDRTHIVSHLGLSSASNLIEGIVHKLHWFHWLLRSVNHMTVRERGRCSRHSCLI